MQYSLALNNWEDILWVDISFFKIPYLNSIDKQYNVINVENSSDQDYKKNIEREFKNVKCILSGENIGYGKGNNIGLKEIKTKYALILNPDAELFPDTITNFFKLVDENSDFAIIQPSTLEDKNKFRNYDLASNNRIWDHGIKLDQRTIKTVRGHALFLNLQKFKNIGFFDENIFFFLEETDLAMRILKSGKKIYYCAPIIIFHEGGKSQQRAFGMSEKSPNFPRIVPGIIIIIIIIIIFLGTWGPKY